MGNGQNKKIKVDEFEIGIIIKLSRYIYRRHSSVGSATLTFRTKITKAALDCSKGCSGSGAVS